jgi:hypothetical protein
VRPFCIAGQQARSCEGAIMHGGWFACSASCASMHCVNTIGFWSEPCFNGRGRPLVLPCCLCTLYTAQLPCPGLACASCKAALCSSLVATEAHREHQVPCVPLCCRGCGAAERCVCAAHHALQGVVSWAVEQCCEAGQCRAPDTSVHCGGMAAHAALACSACDQPWCHIAARQ